VLRRYEDQGLTRTTRTTRTTSRRAGHDDHHPGGQAPADSAAGETLCRTAMRGGLLRLDSVPQPGQCRWLGEVEKRRLYEAFQLR
jgi:hypothetical protein